MFIHYIDKFIQKIEKNYCFPTLAKIIKINSTKDKYCVDCEKLDNYLKSTNTFFFDVDIPKYWGTDTGGIWMTPSVGSIALISFLNGDINYPIVTNIIGKNYAYDHPENTLIIKCNENRIELNSEKIEHISHNAKVSISKEKINIKNTKNNCISIKNNTDSFKLLLLELINQINNIKISGICGCIKNTSNQTVPPGNLSGNSINFNMINIKNKIEKLLN